MSKNKSSFYMGDEINGYSQEVYWIADEVVLQPVSQKNVRLTPNFNKYIQKIYSSISTINNPDSVNPAMAKMMGALAVVNQVIFQDTDNSEKNTVVDTITSTGGDGTIKTFSLGYVVDSGIPANSSSLNFTSNSIKIMGLGKKTEGWKKDKKGNWLYYREGVAVCKDWVKDDNKWYYIDEDGHMVTHWKTINGFEYYFKESGEMVYQWREIGGDWYYFDDIKGYKKKNFWKLYKNSWYYMDEDGIMVTGWKKVKDKWFYFDDTGKMAKGEKVINGEKYSFNSDGSIDNPEYTIEGFRFTVPESNMEQWENEGLAAYLMALYQQYHDYMQQKQEYVSKGAILGCTKGTKFSRLDGSRAADISYLADGSFLLGCKSFKVCENIHTFESCRATKADIGDLPETEKMADGYHKCIPMVDEPWKQDNVNTPRICTNSALTSDYVLKKDAILICRYQGVIGILELPEDKISMVYVPLTLSQKGIDFTALCEGHHDILSNGNYAVIDTNDGKLTTYGGLTIAEKEDGKWKPINNFTMAEVNNRSNGIPPNVWKTNYTAFRSDSENVINKFASDNGVNFTQYQFDALMDVCWTNGNGVFSVEPSGAYTFDFVNILLEPGFLSNPTQSQKDKFEKAFGNLTKLNGIRTSGLWSRRMSELSVFWGETDSNGKYICKSYGNDQQTKSAADAWLIQRGLAPTAR